MRYGVPYRGSKNKIAQWVISNLPAGDTLIDLFAGGCAVTHAALLSGKWNHIVANDIGDAPQLFMDAVHGKYANEKRWISREDFHRLKDSDPYVSLCWSFGNNRTDYLYSKEIEPWKKALHYARVFGDTSLLREFCVDEKNCRLESLCRLQNLNNLQRLQSIQNLNDCGKITLFQKDYRNVEIKEGSIVYADPPYKKTRCTGYKWKFDYDAFEHWLSDVPFMVVISGYERPVECMEVAQIRKQPTIGTNNLYGSSVERLFVQERFAERYKQMMGRF